MRVLRDLAMKTGESFAYPSTSTEASREIRRLMKRKRTDRADRARETRLLREDMATRRGDSSRVRDEELAGYGSTAHWAGDPRSDRDRR